VVVEQPLLAVLVAQEVAAMVQAEQQTQLAEQSIQVVAVVV
jgi:hypothetical protein